MFPPPTARFKARPLLLTAVLSLVLGGGVLAADPGWPRVINAPDGKIVVYEPQIESLDGNVLKGRGAVSLTPKGKTEPVFGAIWFESRIEIDRDSRTVDVLEMKIPRVRFPNSTDADSARYSDIITREAKNWDLNLSLDRMIAGLNAAKREHEQAEDLNMQPPEILFETQPALLVSFDGDPKVVPVHDSELKRVVNTPYFMVQDPGSDAFYLNGADHWFTSEKALGPWKPIATVPPEVTRLYDQTTAKPGPEGSPTAGKTATAGARASGGQVPKIIVSKEPTELIVSDGKPQFAPIAEGNLLYMSNTDSDVIMEVATQKYYVLLSGRWFRSGSMEGPWEFVRPDALPEEFAKIPAASERGDVLAHVAGTPQAEDAVADAAVPQTAAVRRSEAKVSVEYDGDPKFKKIPGTQVEYAVNTSSQVLRIKGKYYACDQAVWFVSDAPDGPWTVCDQVPEEVQQIPPDSPVYNVKYVYVYDHTPDTVYVGYLPPYVGCYPYYGTVVWGTGWYYPGWWGSVYYPWPVTYGFHAHYNSYYGWSFGFGFGWSWGPFYASFGSWGYPGWWGPVGWVPFYRPYPYPIYYPTPYYNHGVYYPGTTRVVRTEAYGTNQNLYRSTGNNGRVAATRDKGPRPNVPMARGVANNVFAGSDGNIYRRTQNGWQTRNPRGWARTPTGSETGAGVARSAPAPHPTTHPSPGTPVSGAPAGPTRPGPPTQDPTQSLDRDYQARQHGDTRTRQYWTGGSRPSVPPPHGSVMPPRTSGPSPYAGGHGGAPPHGGGSAAGAPHGGGAGGAGSRPPSGGAPRGGGGGHGGGGGSHGGGGHPHR